MNRKKRQYFIVAVLQAPHGIRGEFKLHLLSDQKDRMLDLKKVTLLHPDTEEFVSEHTIVHLRGAQHEIILLSDIKDRTQAEKYKSFLVAIPRDEAYELEEGEYFIPDLLGLYVEDKERGRIGIVDDVIQGSAQDVLKIKRKGKKDLYLPFQGGNVIDVLFDTSTILVKLPNGLWEVYE